MTLAAAAALGLMEALAAFLGAAGATTGAAGDEMGVIISSSMSSGEVAVAAAEKNGLRKKKKNLLPTLFAKGNLTAGLQVVVVVS